MAILSTLVPSTPAAAAVDGESSMPQSRFILHRRTKSSVGLGFIVASPTMPYASPNTSPVSSQAVRLPASVPLSTSSSTSSLSSYFSAGSASNLPSPHKENVGRTPPVRHHVRSHSAESLTSYGYFPPQSSSSPSSVFTNGRRSPHPSFNGLFLRDEDDAEGSTSTNQTGALSARTPDDETPVTFRPARSESEAEESDHRDAFESAEEAGESEDSSRAGPSRLTRPIPQPAVASSRAGESIIPFPMKGSPVHVDRRPLPPTQAKSERPYFIRPSVRMSGSDDRPMKIDLEDIPVVIGRAVTPMVRKKSGELVKSSLKGEHGRAKSVPATPTCPKYVHFDTQLEHVKLFLAQQKPTAVSRDGSPQETETEDDSEGFPFPAMATGLSAHISLVLPNFPAIVDPQGDRDVFLEALEIGSDNKSLRGVVVVKNIAFEKRVAIRFTVDQWQTVSEVSADYHETIRDGGADRFVFHIKLQDLLARIEEKKMLLAIRYTVAGTDIWDNNNGENYRAEFKKTQPTRKTVSLGTTNTKPYQWSVTSAGQASERMADLRRELDRLVGDDIVTSPPSSTSSKFPSRGMSTDEPKVKAAASNSPFSHRYDFGVSLKKAPGATASPQGGAAPIKPAFMGTTFIGGMPATSVDESPAISTSQSRHASRFDMFHHRKPAPGEVVAHDYAFAPGQPFQGEYTHMTDPYLGMRRPHSPPADANGPHTPYHFEETYSDGSAHRSSRFNSFPPTRSSPSSQSEHLKVTSYFNLLPGGRPISPGQSPQMSPPRTASPGLKRDHSPPDEDLRSPSSTDTTNSNTNSTVSSPESPARSPPSPSSPDLTPNGLHLATVPRSPMTSPSYYDFINRYCFYQGSGALGLSDPLGGFLADAPRRRQLSPPPSGSLYSHSPTSSSGSTTPSPGTRSPLVNEHMDGPTATAAQNFGRSSSPFNNSLGMGQPAIHG